MFHYPKSCADIFERKFSSNNLPEITKQARHLLKLQQLVQQELGAKYAKQCLVCSFEDRILTLALTNAELRTHLYYRKKALIANLKQHLDFFILFDIKFVILPPQIKPKPKKNPPKLSVKSAQILQNAAKKSNDEAWQKLLIKISKHAGKKH